MKRTLSCLVMLAAASPVYARQVSGRAGTDFFRANTGGAPQDFSLQEVGVSLGLKLKEFDDRLHVRIDYRGREPLGGDVENTQLRLLYWGEVGYEVLQDTLTVTAGRFVAESALFLPVDALRLDLELGKLHISGFGGRRGMTSSRRNVGFSEFLPAAGAGVRWVDRRLQLSFSGAFARDQIPLVNQPDAETLDGVSLMANGMYRPIDSVFVGASASFATRAAYVLGPSWSNAELDVQGLGIYNANLFAQWRPIKALRLDYRAHHQQAQIFSGGFADGSVDFVDPNFLDNRVSVAWAPWDMGWVRASARLRLRNDRTETRGTLSVTVDELGIEGPYLQGRMVYDDVEFDEAGPDLDRLLWRAAAGYQRFGIDAKVGLSFLERAAAPVSGTAFNPRSGAQPIDPTELSPFVLQAQQVFFLQAFYSAHQWYGGLDVEKSLNGDGLRILAQLGAVWGTSW